MYRGWREITNVLLGVRGEPERVNLPKLNCCIIIMTQTITK